MWYPTKIISLAIPEDLLMDVDEAAKKQYMSRSEYIRFVLHKEVPEQKIKPIKKNRYKQGLYDLDDS